MALSYATAIDSVNMDSLPLFSPTLAKSHENVLHSIFSPTNGGANRHYKAPFGDVTNLKTPGGPKPRLPIKASPSIPLASGSDLFFTPASQSPRRRYKVKFQQPSSPGADAFYSPSAFHSSASPLSTISALSYSTTGTSFRSVPIDMLSFGYVTACKSEDELEQIVDSLQADGPGNYPSLLKVAKQRLEVVQKENRHHVTTSLQHDESHLSFSMSHISATSSEPSPLQMKPREDIFRMDLISEDIEEEKRSTAPPIQRSLAWNQTSPTMSNSQGDDSSLIMSLSTAYLKEVDSEILTTTSQSQLNTFFPRNEQLKETTFQASNPGSIRRQIVPVSNQLQEQLRRMRAERTDIEKKLREQVTDLTKNLENVEKARRQDQALLLAKLQEVENKKAQVEEEVTMLEMAVRSSTERAKDVVSTMTEMKNETKFLRKVLDDERRCERLNSSKAKEIEASLREQLKKLSTLLVDSESSAKQAKDMTEMTMRNEFEDERAQHKAAAQALNRCLKDARGMLQNMKSERNNILQSLGEALGKDASEIAKIDFEKRKELVHEVIAKLASSKSAIKAFAKALACSENDRRTMQETKALTELRLADLQLLKNRLERENLLLTKQNQELAQELESSRAYIDNLLATRDDEVQWKAREEDYKRTISALKKQIRTGDSTVSIALYQQAIGEARQHALKCQNNEQEILALRSNVGALKDSLKKAKADSKIRLIKLNKISPSNEHHPQVQVAPFETPQKPFVPVSPPPSTGKQAVRMTVLKAAGGRAGLYAKLKKMRRSPQPSSED